VKGDDHRVGIWGSAISMSGSPNTVNRLPAPVFFSSSPMTRSAFMRTSSTGTRPSCRSPATLAKPGVAVSRGHVSTLAPSTPVRLRVECEAQDAQQVDVAVLDRLLAAALMTTGLTVPYCGPSEMPILVARSGAVAGSLLAPPPLADRLGGGVVAWVPASLSCIGLDRSMRSARCRSASPPCEVVEDRLLKSAPVAVLGGRLFADRLGPRYRSSGHRRRRATGGATGSRR
jgi:hypothetical protein